MQTILYKPLTFLLLFFLTGVFSACSDESGTRGKNSEELRGAEQADQQGPPPTDSEESANVPIDDNRLIVPGERIGQTHIGESLEAVNKRLGPPDSSDAGMGHVWEYRHSSPSSAKRTNVIHELDIYASFDEEATGHYVRQIRITSPWFVTQEGIRSGSSFDSITYVYPDVQPVAEYDEGAKHIVYDDLNEGIGFELLLDGNGNPNRCTGIIVHEPGRAIGNTYIPRYGYKALGSRK